MAIAVGNESEYWANPNGTSFTKAHTQNTGADGLLVVSLAMANTVNISSITYGGQALTILTNSNRTGLSIRIVQAYIKNPPTGSNNLVVNFSGSQFNFVNAYLISYTGADINTTNALSRGAGADPRSGDILGVSANSYVYSRSVSGGSTQSISIDGTVRTGGNLKPNNRNINKITSGALSNVIATAKDVTIINTCSGTASSIDAYEVLEAGAPPTSTDGSFFLTFE